MSNLPQHDTLFFINHKSRQICFGHPRPFLTYALEPFLQVGGMRLVDEIINGGAEALPKILEQVGDEETCLREISNLL